MLPALLLWRLNYLVHTPLQVRPLQRLSLQPLVLALTDLQRQHCCRPSAHLLPHQHPWLQQQLHCALPLPRLLLANLLR
jgi:hypothetical protein